MCITIIVYYCHMNLAPFRTQWTFKYILLLYCLLCNYTTNVWQRHLSVPSYVILMHQPRLLNSAHFPNPTLLHVPCKMQYSKEAQLKAIDKMANWCWVHKKLTLIMFTVCCPPSVCGMRFVYGSKSGRHGQTNSNLIRPRNNVRPTQFLWQITYTRW